MKIVTLKGKDILPVLDAVAKLRIQIFREWPYLYEGDLEAEKNYLKVYANAKDSILILVKENQLPIGIAMGLPLNESIQQVQNVFCEKQLNMDAYYYFADVILLKEYRKKKIGLKMIQRFEQAVRELNTYKQIYFCEILREANDPRSPSTYKSLDSFWESLKYKIIPNWYTHLDWLDIGDHEKTSHLMHFRKKDL